MSIVFSIVSLLLLIMMLDTMGKICNHYLKINKELTITLGFITTLALFFVISVVCILLGLSMLVTLIIYILTTLGIFIKGYQLRKSIQLFKLQMPLKYVLVALAGYLVFIIFNTIEIGGTERFDIVFYYPLISSTFDSHLMQVPFGRILAEVPVTVSTLKDAVLYTFQSYYYLLGFFQKISTLPSVAFIHYIFSFVYIYIFTEMFFFFSKPFQKKKLVPIIIVILLISYMTNPITTLYFFMGSQYVIFIFALIYYALIHLNKTSFAIGLIWGLAFFSTVSSALFLMPLVLFVLLIILVLEGQKQHFAFIKGISLATYIGIVLMLGVLSQWLLVIGIGIAILAILWIAKQLLKLTISRKVSNIIYLILAFSTVVTRYLFAERMLSYFDALVWFAFFAYLLYKTDRKLILVKLLFVHYFLLGNVPVIQYIAGLKTEFDVLQRTFFFSPGRAFYQIVITYLLFAVSFKKSYKYFLIALCYFALSIQAVPNLLYNVRFLDTIFNEKTDRIYFQDKTRVDIIKQLDDYDPSITKKLAVPFRARLISINNELVFTRDWIDWDHRFAYENLYLLEAPDRLDDSINYLNATTDYLIIENKRIPFIPQLQNFEKILENQEFAVYKIN